MNRLAVACSSLVLLADAACISSGQKFPTTGLAELRLGVTTSAQALASFGPPVVKELKKTDTIESTVYHWAFHRSNYEGNRARELSIETVDDVVNGVIFQSAFEDDSTDFDASKAAGLRVNESRAEDAIKLLGRPQCEVRLPSNLLSFTFGTMPEAVPPEGSASALCYFHVFWRVENKLLIRQLKLVTIFCGQDGTILAVRRIEPGP